MNRVLNCLVPVLAVLTIVALAQPVLAGLILNGSFEGIVYVSTPGNTGYIANGSYGVLERGTNLTTVTAGNGNAGMPDWGVNEDTTTSGASVGNLSYVCQNWPIAAEDGNWAILLSTAGNNVEQSFAVTGGATYDVSYYAMGRHDNGKVGVITASIALAAGSATGTTSQAESGLSTTTWTKETFSFTPNTTTTATLEFFETADPTTTYQGDMLDKVDVTQTPEPSTLILLGTGLVALLCYAWRKRKGV